MTVTHFIILFYRKKKGAKNRWDKYKTNSKIVNLNPSISLH